MKTVDDGPEGADSDEYFAWLESFVEVTPEGRSDQFDRDLMKVLRRVDELLQPFDVEVVILEDREAVNPNGIISFRLEQM